jgi:hypothetical protein
MRMDIRENFLERHGKGCDLGVLRSSLATLGISPAGSNARNPAQLRLYLMPSALGAAQDDRGRQFRHCYLLFRDAGHPRTGSSVAISSRNATGNEISRARSVVAHTYFTAIAASNAAVIAFSSAIAVQHRQWCASIQSE